MNIGKVPGFHLLGPVCHLVAIHPQVARQELGFFARKEPDTMDWFHGGTPGELKCVVQEFASDIIERFR